MNQTWIEYYSSLSNMALLGSKRIHYTIMDSRGSGLQDLIHKTASREFMDIAIRDKDTLVELIQAASDYLSGHPFDVVYAAGGVWDIVSLDETQGKFLYTWGDQGGLQIHLISTLNKANDRLKKDFPASKVVFCPLVACELSRLKGLEDVNISSQVAIENAVWEFNSTVFRINRENGAFSPAIHHQVHRFCKGKRRAYYHHLTDGLQPGGLLREKWASEFIKVMAQN